MVSTYRPMGPTLQVPQAGQNSPWWSQIQTTTGQQAQQLTQPYQPAAPGAGESPWFYQPQGSAPQQSMAGDAWNYARTANPDPSGNLPGTPGYVSPDTSQTTTIAGGKPPVPGQVKQPWLAGQGQAAGTPGTETKTGTGQSGQQQVQTAGVIDTAKAPNYGVAVQPDGSWKLPNGTIIPPNARTTVDILGQQVALPFYNGVGMPGRGDFRFTDGVGRQSDALSMLVQRLSELKRGGANLNDPNVIYDAIARIRDDAMASGVPEADLDRATGIGGLQNFIRSREAGSQNPAAPQGAPPPVPPGTQPPPAANPGTAPPASNPAPTPTTPGGGGRFDPLAIKAASEDQRLGYDMLMQYLTGSNKSGTGPFAGFLEDFFAPIATSMINAMATTNGQMPTNIDDLFASIKSGVGPNASTNLYDTMSNAARNAMQKTLGGGDVSFDEMQAAAGTYTPLMTRMLNPIQARMFQRQMGDQMRAMQAPSYTDMLGANHGNYGGDFLNSQFYNNWWNQR